MSTIFEIDLGSYWPQELCFQSRYGTAFSDWRHNNVHTDVWQSQQPITRRTIGCVPKYVKWLSSKWLVKSFIKGETEKSLGFEDEAKWLAKLLHSRYGIENGPNTGRGFWISSLTICICVSICTYGKCTLSAKCVVEAYQLYYLKNVPCRLYQ